MHALEFSADEMAEWQNEIEGDNEVLGRMF